MDAYDVTRAARMVSDFAVDQLSNWYVRRNRRRFWKSEPGRDKTAAYQTLYEALVTVLKMAAPFAPFIAEEVYRNLNGVTHREGEESVHLALLPAPEEGAIDPPLERRMERAEKIVMLVRAMRMKSNLKVRQPLQRIILPIADDGERHEVESVADIICEEVNVKGIEYVTDDSGIVRRKAKANFKSIGPKFGKNAQAVAARIREMTPAEIATLERTGALSVAGGGGITLGREDVEILREDIEGWLVESDGSLTVALDTALTDALIAEGNAREFVNRVQNLRKDAGFEVTDRITITFQASPAMRATLLSMKPYITAETLAVEFAEPLRPGDHQATVEVNGEALEVAIARIART
jgi:isoleucyl-tRNA synthetase